MKIPHRKILNDIHLFKLEDFVIHKQIGEGKFAKVCKAISKSGNIVALRKLKVTEAATVNKKKLQREARDLINLNHPNIVACYGVILNDVTFINEYCSKIFYENGELTEIYSLLGIIRSFEDDIPIKVRLKAIHDISNGLSYLHDIGIIAGDLKPSNILVSSTLTEQWVFKLTDLSLKGFRGPMQTLMSTSYNLQQNDVAYTLYYLAPELIKNNLSLNLQNTDASDIYSLSIVMYEVLFPGIELEVFPTIPQQLEAVRDNWRPNIPDGTHDVSINYMIELMKKCWNECPLNRPKAQEIFQLTSSLLSEVTS